MHLPPSRVVLGSLLSCIVAALTAGCSQFPTVGPSTQEIVEVSALPGTQVVQVVDVDSAVAQQLMRVQQQQLFSETLSGAAPAEGRIGAGDMLEVSIWEAPPAALFGAGIEARGVLSAARSTTLPEQLVDREGFISVPFAGRVAVLGQSPHAVESEIVRRLRGKANQPEVLVRITRSSSAAVTVVGDVATSLRMPLTPSGERLLDALAAAGGVRQPVNKMMLQVTRGATFHTMPLDQVIRDPRQNVPLRAGDVITALFQPYSYMALGATGKNDEINFEAQGINLSQALARAGGLLDSRSSPQGVFVFRFEAEKALDWPRKPVVTTPGGLVPVVYRLDLRNPYSFFVMQNFAINHKDVLYISNAPSVELQKFLNLVFSLVYPLNTAVGAFN